MGSTITPAQYPAGAGPMPEVPGVEVEHEFYDLPAGRFHVARVGDRSLPAIMLVHGFPQHWWSWRGVIAELAKEAHIILPDLRGSGWSAVPTDRSAYKKTDMAEDVVGLLDAMGIEQIAIGAHDWGGWISQIVAIDHPGRVRRLLLFSIPPILAVPAPPLRSMLRMYYQLVFAAPGSAKFIMPSGRFAAGIRADVQRRDAFTREDATAFAAPYRDPARAKAAQGMYRSFLLGDARSLMKRFKGKRFQMPVRYILSAHDGYIPPEFGKQVSHLGPEVDAFVQDGTGHFVPDEDPHYTAEQIRDWLLPHAVPLS